MTVERAAVAPTVKSAVGGNSYTDVMVIFSESVSESRSSNAGNYSLSGGLTRSEVLVLVFVGSIDCFLGVFEGSGMDFWRVRLP